MPVKIEQKLGTLEGLAARWLEMWIFGTRWTVVVDLGHPIMRRTASLNSLEPPNAVPTTTIPLKAGAVRAKHQAPFLTC